MGIYLQKTGGEFGVNTGRPRRCGWYDAVLARHASRVNGFTDYFVTKLDVLTGIEQIPVCVAYEIDGKRVDIASARVKKGDVISLSEKARNMIVVQHNLDVLDRNVVGWLEVGDGGKQVTVRDLPQREHIDVPVRESLIVELYSK